MTFTCPYAEPGENRCPEWRCDCFIETHPDDPFGLHPEDFVVVGAPVTKTGKVLTVNDLQDLVKEAEAGYDLEAPEKAPRKPQEWRKGHWHAKRRGDGVWVCTSPSGIVTKWSSFEKMRGWQLWYYKITHPKDEPAVFGGDIPSIKD